MGRTMTDIEIVTADMQKHGDHGAWDWEADLRFAQAIGDDEAVRDCANLLRSNAPYALQIMAHRVVIAPRITWRRVRALRQLVRGGKARSFWLGTGPRGRTEFGVNRVRHYRLVD